MTRIITAILLGLLFISGQTQWAAANDPDQESNAPITLVLGINEHPYTASLIPLIPEFENATGIKVQVETFFPEEKWLAARAADVSSGAGHFDVMMLDMVVTQYARTGWIEPLDAYLQDPTLVDLADYDMNDIPSGLRKYGTVDGHIYGIPVDADAEILYYRKDLFDQQGLRAPTTMDELYLTAAKLDNPGMVAGICMRGRNIFSVINFSGFLWSFGGQHFDDLLKPSQAMFNQPAGVTALNQLARLLQDAGPQGVGDYSWEECARDFQQGRVAMYVDSSLLMSTFEDADKSTVHGLVGYAPLPKGPNGSVSNSFNWMMGINAASKNKQAAFRFIAWASGKDISLRTAIVNGSSARESVWRSPEFLSAFPHPTWAEVTITSMKNAGPEAPFPRVTQIDDFLTSVGSAINSVITGNTDAQTALDNAAKHMNALLTPDAPRTSLRAQVQPGADILRPGSGQGFQQSIQFSQFNELAEPAQRTINAILQDRNGFIWFGTDDGLYKYDGYRFTLYKQHVQNPADGVGHNFISALLEDRAGNLWVGTWGGGLSMLDPLTQKFTHYVSKPGDADGLSQMRVRTLYEDQTGILWIGTFDGGLDAFDPTRKKFTHYRHSNNADSLIHNVIWSICADHAGALWIGTAGGLDRFEPTRQRFVHYRNDPTNTASLSNDTVMAVFEDSANVLWVGTRNGLNRFDREQGRFTRYRHDSAAPDSLSNNVVMSIYEDRTGTLWVGTEGGLNAFDRKLKRFTRYTKQPGNLNSLSDDRVRTVFQDRSGLLWVGTYRGISTLQTPSQFALYQNTSNALNSNYIRALLPDTADTLWIGANDGLSLFDRRNGTTRRYLHDPRNPTSINTGLGINVIYRDRQGCLWLGGWNMGLERLDPQTGRFTHYLHQEGVSSSLSHNTIFAIHQDGQGILWIGTAHGLNRLDPVTEQFSTFCHTDDNRAGFAADDVRVIREDETGTLWLGSRFNGITRFDPTRGQFKVYTSDATDAHGPANNSITSILQDQTGALWFGTAAGLSRLDRQTETFSNFPLAPGERVRCVLEDSQGRLWVSTTTGLGQYIPELGTFTRYSLKDGLQGEIFNNAACARASTGEMFFGGTNGVNSFNPLIVQKTAYAPPVVLTDLHILGKSVTPGPGSVLQKPIWQTERLTLSYLQNTLAMEFAALDYVNPRQNRYQYKLDGYETAWHEADSNQRVAEYTNLPPGDYVLHVRATSQDNVWSTHDLTLALTLIPPWWNTWLFRSALLLGLAGVLSGVYRWRTRAILQQTRRLETSVNERTADLRASNARATEMAERAEQASQAKGKFLASMSHELRTPLNAILGYAQILQRDPAVTEHQAQRLKVIEQSGTHLLTLINDVLDMARIEAGKIELAPENFQLLPFLASVNDPMRVRAELKGLRYRFETSQQERKDIPPLPAAVHGDVRRLRQILLNLLGNAIKFTDSGEIILQVEQLPRQPANQPARLRFTIRDTGVGIAPEQLSVLFKPFVQVGDTRRRQEGTGLGLSITYELVKLMGGTLQAQSVPGQGSTFRFEVSLPVVTATPAPVAQARRIVTVKGRTPTILIVDDKAENRAVLVDMLAPLGFKVLEADNGHDGLARTLADRPAALITDLVMPEMDGFELIRQVRRAPGLEQTIIIAASASVFEEHQRASFVAGSNAFLPKPVQVDQLLEILQRYLGLKWIYAEVAPETPPLDAVAPLIPPAPDELARLLDLLRRGDIGAVQQAAAQLESEDPTLRPFARELRHQAASFDMHRLRAWLTEMQKGGPRRDK